VLSESRSDPRDADASERFLRLSSTLTGFNRVELLGTGVADVYLRALEDVLPADVLERLLAGDADPDGVLADPALGPPARNLILMWYCGTWTPLPDDWRAAHGASELDTHRVISPDGYVAGLQWVAAGAHPVGARQQGFGAWAVPPDPDGIGASAR